jgi:hypothetical protein
MRNVDDGTIALLGVIGNLIKKIIISLKEQKIASGWLLLVNKAISNKGKSQEREGRTEQHQRKKEGPHPQSPLQLTHVSTTVDLSFD